jgi:hypothetical protein
LGLFNRDTSDWLEGTATVLAEHPTNTYFYGPHDLQGRPALRYDKLDLQIALPGRAPYVLERKRQGIPTGMVGLEGRTVPVKVHPKKKDKFDISWAAAHAEGGGGQGVTISFVSRDGGAALSPPLQAAKDPLDRLEKLGRLHASGVLTDAEFAAEKAKILGA